MSPDDETTSSSVPVPDSPSPPSSPDPNSNPTPTPTPFLSALHSFPLSKSPPTADPPHQPLETPLSTALPSPSINPIPNSPSINPNPNSPSPSPTFNPNPNQAETLPRHQLQHPSTSTSTCSSKRKTLHKDDTKAGSKAKKSLPHPVLPVQDEPCQPRSQPILPPSPLALPEITNLQQIIQHLSGDFDEAKYADMDILDIAEKKGIVFDDPPWWPPGGFPDTI